MFLVHRNQDGHVQPFESRAAGAITPKTGLALYENAGVLAVAAGTTKPTYICVTNAGGAVASGTMIDVQRVDPGAVYETECTAAFTDVKAGSKVTLSADGLGVTATTTSGVAEVVQIDGTAIGSRILVRF